MTPDKAASPVPYESIWVIVRPSGEMGVTYPTFAAADAYRMHLGWDASTVRRYDLASDSAEVPT